MSDEIRAIAKTTVQGIIDAVREKEGSTEPIPVNALADRIGALQIGGGNVFAEYISGTKTELYPEDFRGVSTIGASMFYYNSSLSYVEMPETVTTLQDKAFNYAKISTIKTYATNIGASALYLSSSTEPHIYLLSNTFDTLGKTVFGSDSHIHFNSEQVFDNFLIKASANPDNYPFNSELKQLYIGDTLLTEINVSAEITYLSDYFLAGLSGIKKGIEQVIFEGDVTSVGTHSFYNCQSMKVIDFTKCTQVPTLRGTYAFYNMSNKKYQIKVPSALYDEWISATNWSSVANKIVAV